jgi:hypothetical protein
VCNLTEGAAVEPASYRQRRRPSGDHSEIDPRSAEWKRAHMSQRV